MKTVAHLIKRVSSTIIVGLFSSQYAEKLTIYTSVHLSVCLCVMYAQLLNVRTDTYETLHICSIRHEDVHEGR